MKQSLFITVVIFALAAFLSWKNHQQIAHANREREKVRIQAASLGISLDASGKPISSTRRQQRELPETDVKKLAAELIGFARELETSPDSADAASLEEREQRLLDWQRRLSSLDPARMKELIAEITSAADIKDSTRQDLLLLALETLTENHPDATLALMAETPDLLKNSYARTGIVSSALLRRLEQDPDSAIRWYQENKGLFSGVETERITGRLLVGTGSTNPKLAFSLITSLGLTDIESAVSTITHPARNADQRSATLSAFRDFMKTLPASADRDAIVFEGNSTLIRGSFFEGFDSAIQWIGNAGFSPQELETFAERVHFISPADCGKYLDWLLQTIPTEATASRIVREQFFGWVQADYQAAGQWLEALPEGPTREAAAGSYAYALAEHHPEAAARWIEAVPASERNPGTVNLIHQHWPKSDPAGAAAFAAKHGIKE